MCHHTTQPLHTLLAALPKCEHHMHVEGSLSPELLFELAQRNGVALPPVSEDAAFASVEALYARYARFTSLDDFLHYYYIGMSVLQTAADFEALAMAYFEKAHAANVRHAEIFFDPQVHLARGVSLADVVRGLRAASRRATAELGGMTCLLIPCLLRHLPVADSGQLVAQLREGYWADGDEAAQEAAVVQALDAAFDREADADSLRGALAGLGLCSSERDLPPTLWRDVFREARRHSVSAPDGSTTRSTKKPARRGATRITAHAGEEGPAEYVALALDHLGAQRIDHGIAAATDTDLMARLAADQILLTVCPLSNVCLKAAPSVADVPIRVFLDAGVPFSINSDDPAYFGGYIQENYCAVQDAHNLAAADWATIAHNAVRGSWCDEARKTAIRNEIDSVMAAWEAGTLSAPKA
ncbi:adenosine deaminase [Sporothrix brasiliensis 5110]|uniref:Adenine deaminase n=1 Tax=Sporothrix brasiliensis 5110 TaxID=1398154 RepID=A0A0C2IP42_9PEZI|nr:adenosine deaminase [Sporothrix brasiliensis 5110]KIH90801.1 adenosine deaminase [Sporothrix brasiliensis 5110]